MSESVQIPVDLLAETRAVLDCALRVLGEPEVYTKVMRVREKLGNLSNGGTENCDKLSADKKQAGYHLLRRLDELKREIKKDYGLEK